MQDEVEKMEDEVEKMNAQARAAAAIRKRETQSAITKNGCGA
jgi:hypothetical protein